MFVGEGQHQSRDCAVAGCGRTGEDSFRECTIGVGTVPHGYSYGRCTEEDIYRKAAYGMKRASSGVFSYREYLRVF